MKPDKTNQTVERKFQKTFLTGDDEKALSSGAAIWNMQLLITQRSDRS